MMPALFLFRNTQKRSKKTMAPGAVSRWRVEEKERICEDCGLT